jgi:hypothetical protein
MKLTSKQLHLINATLLKDEKSSDQELIAHFQEYLKCSLKIASKIVSKREAIRHDPLNVEVTNKDLR